MSGCEVLQTYDSDFNDVCTVLNYYVSYISKPKIASKGSGVEIGAAFSTIMSHKHLNPREWSNNPCELEIRVRLDFPEVYKGFPRSRFLPLAIVRMVTGGVVSWKRNAISMRIFTHQSIDWTDLSRAHRSSDESKRAMRTDDARIRNTDESGKELLAAWLG